MMTVETEKKSVRFQIHIPPTELQQCEVWAFRVGSAHDDDKAASV